MPASKTIKAAMEVFLASLNAAHTARTYATALKHFGAYLEGRGIDPQTTPASALTVDQAIEYVPWLRHERFPDPEQPAKATLQLYLTTVYRFYRSLLKGGAAFAAADIARLEETYRDARNIRGEPRPKDPKLAAVEAIIEAARSAPPTSGDQPVDQRRELMRLRDIAIVETLRSTGCRVGELVALRRGDLDWLARSALVKGKGSKYRKVYLDPRAWSALKAYLDARRDGADARGLSHLPVFSGHGNRSGSRLSPLTTRHVSRLIRDLAAQAGIAEVGVTPHYFRHVFATRALDRTGNLALVQDMLGHASPATTRVYARTDEEQRRAGYGQVWEGMEHRVDMLSGRGGEFDLAVPIVRVVRVEDGEQEGTDEGEGLPRRMRAAMIEVLWATGCSLEELVVLRLEDVDLEAREVRFVAYGVTRIARLTPEAVAALQAYLQVRGGAQGDALLVEEGGAPLTRAQAFDILRSAAREAGIVEESIPPDLFRRTFVRRALDAAGDLETVHGMVGEDAAPRE